MSPKAIPSTSLEFSPGNVGYLTGHGYAKNITMFYRPSADFEEFVLHFLLGVFMRTNVAKIIWMVAQAR